MLQLGNGIIDIRERFMLAIASPDLQAISGFQRFTNSFSVLTSRLR